MTNSDAEIRHIYERWHESVVTGDLDALVALYAPDAVLETPLIVATLPGKTDGILKGRAEIRSFFEAGFRKLRNSSARWYRTGLFFANGRQLVWEYPRQTPNGDQVDLVEVMDVADGLIVSHRVYWGWVGFKTLVAALQGQGADGSRRRHSTLAPTSSASADKAPCRSVGAATRTSRRSGDRAAAADGFRFDALQYAAPAPAAGC